MWLRACMTRRAERMLSNLHLGPIIGLAQAVPIACKLLIDGMLEMRYDRTRWFESGRLGG